MPIDKSKTADGDKISFLSPWGILTGVRDETAKQADPSHIRVLVVNAKGRLVNEAFVALTDADAKKEAASKPVGPFDSYPEPVSVDGEPG